MKKRTIKATVDAGRLLSKVDRVFDASPTTIFGELLQNARRAGATSVIITMQSSAFLELDTDTVLVSITDNGSGIEDPMSLLEMGGAGWDESTEQTEDPAGMGFFSLSNFDSVTVRSRDWLTTIRQSVFRGESAATVSELRLEERREGTTIVWWWEDVPTASLQSALRSAAQYCGIELITLVVDSADPVQIEPKGFLDGYRCVERFEDRGYSLAVNHNANSTGLRSQPPRIWFNFWGTTISIIMPMEYQELGALQCSVRVDVWRTGEGDLQMVLPARNAVKHNTTLSQLMQACERKIFEHTALHRKGKHRMPFKGYTRAAECGYDIGPAECRLSLYGDHDDRRSPSSFAILKPPLSHHRFLRNLVREEAADVTFVKPDQGMEGYKWYDEMRQLTEVDVLIDGKPQDTEELFADRYDFREEDDENLFKFVDKLEVVYKFSDDSSVHIEPLVLIGGDQLHYDWGDVSGGSEIFLLRTVRTDTEERQEAMYLIRDALFATDYDADDPEPNDQEREFLQGLQYAMLEVCCSDMAAARWELEAALNKFYAGMGSQFAWTVSYDGGRHYKPRLVSLRKCNQPACHVLVTTLPHDVDGVAFTMVSDEEVTPQRVEAYLQRVVGHDPDKDSYLIEIAGDPVDLDKWESKMKSNKQTQHGKDQEK